MQARQASKAGESPRRRALLVRPLGRGRYVRLQEPVPQESGSFEHRNEKLGGGRGRSRECDVDCFSSPVLAPSPLSLSFGLTARDSVLEQTCQVERSLVLSGGVTCSQFWLVSERLCVRADLSG